MEHRSITVGFRDIKLDANQGRLSGWGAVFGNVDSYGDVIRRGAFGPSLDEWKQRGKLPKMLLQHGGWGLTPDDLTPIGKWDSMEETRKGLKVEGHLFAIETDRGQYVYEGLKSGELDGLSIGFTTRKYEMDEETDVRTLTDIELHEVSVVTFPANSEALVTNVKNSALFLRELEDRLRDGGFSHREAAKAAGILNHSLRDGARRAGPNGSDSRDPDEEEVLRAAARITGGGSKAGELDDVEASEILRSLNSIIGSK